MTSLDSPCIVQVEEVGRHGYFRAPSRIRTAGWYWSSQQGNLDHRTPHWSLGVGAGSCGSGRPR